MLSPSFHKGAALHTHFLPGLWALGGKGNLPGPELVFRVHPQAQNMDFWFYLQFIVEEMETQRGQGHTVSGSRFKARQGLLPRSLVDPGVSVLFCASTPHLFPPSLLPRPSLPACSWEHHLSPSPGPSSPRA